MTLAACAKLHKTKGGLIDTELNELAVTPTSSPLGVRTVTMVTPVANMAKEERNSRDEKVGAPANGWVTDDNIELIYIRRLVKINRHYSLSSWRVGPVSSDWLIL